MTTSEILSIIEIILAIVVCVVCAVLLHKDIQVMRKVNQRLDKFDEWYKKHYGKED